MSKRHTYAEDAARCVDCGDDITPFEIEGQRQAMLERCLKSIEDLLDEAATGSTVLSFEQRNEMEEIIKDSRVQGLP